MQVQINFGDVDTSPALDTHVRDSVAKSLRHVLDRITRVEVHVRDDKSQRTGPDDARCTMEARLAGEQPLAVDAKGADLYRVVADAADKLAAAVQRRIGKREG